jgi:pullulanase
VGSIKHPQVDYSKIADSKAPWAAEPYQTINYASCHDDNTLWDRLKISNPDATEADLIKMDKLANAIVLTSQGVAFLHAGEEMLRTKQGVANSFKSPDSINQIDWARKAKYKSVFNYYKGMVALRKAHPAFRMPSAKMINTHLKFINTSDDHFIAYKISGNANGDSWKTIIVLLNGDSAAKTFKLPGGGWKLAANSDRVSEKGISSHSGTINIPATTAYILYQ